MDEVLNGVQRTNNTTATVEGGFSFTNRMENDLGCGTEG